MHTISVWEWVIEWRKSSLQMFSLKLVHLFGYVFSKLLDTLIEKGIESHNGRSELHSDFLNTISIVLRDSVSHLTVWSFKLRAICLCISISLSHVDFPLVTNTLLSIFKVALGSDDIMVDSEVWHKVIFVMLVLVSLKLHWSSCFSLSDTFWECERVTSRNGLLLNKGVTWVAILPVVVMMLDGLSFNQGSDSKCNFHLGN